VIADLLPPAVAAVESIGPEPDPGGGLFPAEAALVRTAGPRRRAEFTAGRACARVALAALGLPAAPILAGRAGEPRWPAGVTGSITHCPGYRACAAAWLTDVAGLGIDAEPDAPLPAGLIESVAGPAERAWIARQAASAPAVHWDRLVFSARESVGKLWYPLNGHWPEPGELTVFPEAAGTFEARVAGPAPARLGGRWLARDGLIVTAVAWPTEARGAAGAAIRLP
jgi:enterobactin synthetase component D / holo-[acyl-carrier protein] synthase